jgi:hypothetical protein
MELETLFTVGKIAAALVSIGTAIKYVPKGYRWIRSWKLIKRRDFEALQKILVEHQKCEAEKERLRKLNSPMAREIRAYLENPPDVKVDSEFNVLEPFKNR